MIMDTHLRSTCMCPACGGNVFHSFIDFGVQPRSGTFLRRVDDAPPLTGLKFEYCTHCGFLRQTPSRAQSVDYTHVSRPTTQQLPAYAADILARLHARVPDPKNNLVVEVGANDGNFLNLLRGNGFANRLGIEPSRELARICGEAGHPVDNTHLDANGAQHIVKKFGLACSVLCRHTLEHVPDPMELLQSMRRLLRTDGHLYIEVPDVAPIVDWLFAHELWDEHLSYFSPGNLRHLVSRAGFKVTEMRTVAHRGSQNLMLWAQACAAKVADEDGSGVQPLSASWASFDSRWNTYRNELQRQAVTWREPVIAMGASHPQSNFLLFSGLGDKIDVLLDDDLNKSDRCVPLPNPIPVMTTAHALLSDMHDGTLLQTAFGYPGWTRQARDTFKQRGFTAIDPLEFIPHH